MRAPDSEDAPEESPASIPILNLSFSFWIKVKEEGVIKNSCNLDLDRGTGTYYYYENRPAPERPKRSPKLISPNPSLRNQIPSCHRYAIDTGVVNLCLYTVVVGTP